MHAALPPIIRRLFDQSAILIALLFAVAVWIVLPSMVVAVDDDFWYLRSVVETLQRGRPWTDEWLAPWAASTSVISALIYKISGSFTLAIHLPLAAAAGMACWGMQLRLRTAGMAWWSGGGLALLVLGAPTALFMLVMYTSVSVYLACAWWCIHFAAKRQWWWFLLPFAIGLAGRQSAVVWLALPGMALLESLWQSRSPLPRTREAWRIVLLLAAAGAWLLTIKLGMNLTPGQQTTMVNAEHFVLGDTLMPVAFGLVIFVTGHGIGALASLRAGWEKARARARFWWWLALLAAAGMAGALQWFIRNAQTLHDCFRDPLTAVLVPFMGALLGAGVILAGRRPNAGCVLAALGSVTLVALYRGICDYYFLDALFFGIASALPVAAASPPTDRTTQVRLPLRMQAFLALVAIVMAVWVTRGGIKMTVDQNRTAAIIRLYEKALDDGKLAPAEVGSGPFGYLGWLFIDYFGEHDGHNARNVAAFMRYVQGWDGRIGTGVLTTYKRPLNQWRNLVLTRNNNALKNANGQLLGELEAPVLGRHQGRFTIKRVPSDEPVTGSKRINPAELERIPFPLNDEQWRKFIEEHTLSSKRSPALGAR